MDNELVLAMHGSNIPTETFIEEPTLVLVLRDFSSEQISGLVFGGEGFSLRELVNDSAPTQGSLFMICFWTKSSAVVFRLLCLG